MVSFGGGGGLEHDESVLISNCWTALMGNYLYTGWYMYFLMQKSKVYETRFLLNLNDYNQSSFFSSKKWFSRKTAYPQKLHFKQSLLDPG